MVSKWLPIILIIMACWILLAGFLFVQFWPNIPRTNLQWYLFIGFGPPLYVLCEEFFGWLFSARHGYAISTAKFSIFRILVALALAVIWLGVSWWLTSLLTA